MQNRALPSPKSDEVQAVLKRRVVTKKAHALYSPPPPKDFISLAKLPGALGSWIADNRSAGLRPSYLAKIQGFGDRLVWWMERESVSRFDADCVRSFLTYIRTAHELTEGRWGEKGLTRADYEGKVGVANSIRYRAVSAVYVDDYHRILKAFGSWAEGVSIVDTNPLKTVKKPIVRKGVHDFRVFSEAEVHRIFAAARRTSFPKRDYAVCLFLLDTGVRVSELAALTWADVVIEEKKARIAHGKGDKSRTVHWSGETARALQIYIAEYGINDLRDPVFFSLGGHTSGAALTTFGIRQIVEKIGIAASVSKCTPHAFRHTYATLYILNGGQQMALKDLMGHTDLSMTEQYVRFAGADLAGQARQFSPVALLKKGTRGKV